jgi:zinc protease
MNLREDKHWSYGVRATLMPARGPSPFIIRSPVQTDKTSESMVEIDKELHSILSGSPVTDDELTTAKKDQTLKLPGQWETESHVAASVAQIVRFGWPDDYFVTYPDRVRALTLSEIAEAAPLIDHPDNTIWVIVGDRSKIEQSVRDLGWGEIHFIDADGNPAR